mmetsp:Transcript_30594/g.44460  ORF Transcript_30594/g.44460 Transcript_30594/m.44460 type:complete len:81 (-) Transcript_30594:858-1100(-)
MYNSLAATPEDEAFFTHNGVLQLCRRGAAVKVSFQLFGITKLHFVLQLDLNVGTHALLYSIILVFPFCIEISHISFFIFL